MLVKEGDFVVPGDVLRELIAIKSLTLRGPGHLRFKQPNIYWIDGHQKRYYPKKGDLVVGIIAKKSGEVFKVDIGSSELASLPLMAFEGATKKQKPDLQVGDAVYARLLSAHREMEPELVCVDSYFKAGKLGPLSSEGFVMNLSLRLVNQLLDVESPLLRTLGRKFVYEVAVGMNGKVWVNAKTTKDILSLMNALLAAEVQSNKDIMDLCKQY